MGKGHRHLKKLKSEKSKVKLKQSKKLKKADNVTDTSFKVKQIIIREQLRVKSGEEPLSRRKLNLKELLVRLRHYNATERTNAVIGLKEIVTLYPTDVVLPNLNQLLQESSHLILDEEKSIRREALKLFKLILIPVSSVQLSPFFNILCSYLRCAMTHINSNIQEDSLLFLDLLLVSVPSLVAQKSNEILPNFFDLISKLRNDFKPGRTLTINLGTKLSSIKWRTKVLNSFHQILTAIIAEKKKKFSTKENRSVVKSVKFDPGNLNYFPVYQIDFKKAFSLQFNDKSLKKSETQEESENDIMKYIDILLPLLFETWLEVGPNKSDENTMDSNLSNESLCMLSSILNIMKKFWKFIKLYEQELGNTEIANKFISKYSKNFVNYFVKYFPYIEINTKKRKRNDTKNAVRDYMCVDENLSICYLFCIFNTKFNNKTFVEYATKVIEYVKSRLLHYRSENANTYQLLLLVLKSLLEVSESWSKQDLEISVIIDSAIKMYSSKYLTENMKFDLFYVLSNVLSKPQFNKLPSYQIWLSYLPELLCKEEISEKVINIVSSLSKQKNVIFTQSFINKIPKILENLETVRVIDNENKYEVINNLIQSFYWLPIYDTKNLNVLQNYIKTSKDVKICTSLTDLLKMRYELKEESIVADTINDLKNWRTEEILIE